MQSIRKAKNLKGKTVLLRADFNVPIVSGKILDTNRIEKALPTINFLRKKGAKIILLSHSDSEKDKASLLPVSKFLNRKFKVRFINESMPKSLVLSPGEIVLLENIRREKGEKANDESFAKKLASFADIYVNEAFPVSHREHASVVSVSKYLPSFVGLQFEEEIKNLKKVLTGPRKPFLSIIAGAKFETKIPLIEKFLEKADFVFVGGALANNFLKERGFRIGKSLFEKGIDISKYLNDKKIILPEDLLVLRSGKIVSCFIENVLPNDIIVDIGPKTVKILSLKIKSSKTVVWNGPLGKYEIKGAEVGTKKVLSALASNKGCFSVIGGGDITAVATNAIKKKLSFVSTGGGATLEYLSKGTLPGIEAIEKSGK